MRMTITTRMTLEPGEVAHLPAESGDAAVRVLSGAAWVTRDREDVILTAGDAAEPLKGSTKNALVSALGEAPVVLEFEGGKDQWLHSSTRREWPNRRSWRPWRGIFSDRRRRGPNA